MNDRQASPKPAATIGIALLACLLMLLASPASAKSRTCASTTMTEPFVLPGGLEHPPGELMLCHHLKYSPSKMLMLTYVDREPTGLLLGHRGQGESTTTTKPFMMFARDAAGRLHLYGYAMPRRGGLDTFTLAVAPGPGGTKKQPDPERVATVDRTGDRVSMGPGAPIVLVSAVAR